MTTTPTKRLLLIINPISGVSDKEALEPLVRETMAPLGYKVDVSYTACSGDATRLTRRAVDKGYDAVIAAGGDGTVNETANALCGTDVIFGIIPCGSGNGLARHLGLPLVPEKAVQVLARHNVVNIDYGSVNGRPFFCTFGVGFDAAVSSRFARQHRRGKMSYIKSTIEEYLSFNPQEYTVHANGCKLTERVFLIAVCNASQYGNNAYIAPRASLTDGLLDITIVHAGNPFSTALVGLDLMTGTINQNMLIHSFRAPSATIIRRIPGPAHLDGDPVDLGETMEIKCHPASLRILTVENEVKFRPIITPLGNMSRDFMRDISGLFERITSKI